MAEPGAARDMAYRVVSSRGPVRAAAVALAAIVASGCGQGATKDAPNVPAEPAADAPRTIAATAEHTPEPSELVGAWVLRDLGGRGVIDTTETTLELDADGRASGSAGCNRYTGSYSFVDGELSFGPLAATRMMCPDEMMAQEDGFLGALGAVDRVAIAGPELLIWVTGSEAPLRLVRFETGAEAETGE